MQRTRTYTHEKATAILTGDWHLREDNPTCRMDDFEEAQWRKVDFIADLQRQHSCPVIHAGDLFNHWKPSPYLLSQAIKHLPEQFHTIYGNHDLPQHNLELANKCGINVLKEAGRLQIADGSHWGQEPMVKATIPMYSIWEYERCVANRGVLIWHVMTYQGKKPWPTCTDPMAAGLLRRYPQCDLIVTGHNHKTFVEEYEGRLLVNPGSITRQTADQIDHKPCVFLWYAKENKIIPVYLPYKEDIISREHIEVIEQRDARIDAFIARLDGDWEVGMSFEQNLEEFCKVNNIRDKVKEIIYKAIDQ